MVAIAPLLILLVLAVIVVLGARRFRVPYTVALVVLGFGLGIAGAAVGYTPLTADVRGLLAPGLFFDLLLPPIIFVAALNVNFRLLRRRAALILFLAFVGVVFITLFTGFVLAYFTVLPLTAALLLAAILSPTDPITVVDLFRRLKVPAELATIVESESLLNDAVGVMLFAILLDLIANGTTSPVGALVLFGWLTGGGIAVGLGVAGAVYLLHRQLNDAAVETAVSVVAAYGSFLLAQQIGASGIIACAISGIAVGTWVAPSAMTAEVRGALDVFWNVVLYIANSVIFLAMGLVFALGRLLDYLGLILFAVAVLTVGRLAFVYLHRPLSGRSGARLPNSWYNVISIAGIRGAIPVVLALSLLTTPSGLAAADRDAIVATTLGVAFVSIVVGNLVADWYVTRTFRPDGDAAPAQTVNTLP